MHKNRGVWRVAILQTLLRGAKLDYSKSSYGAPPRYYLFYYLLSTLLYISYPLIYYPSFYLLTISNYYLPIPLYYKKIAPPLPPPCTRVLRARGGGRWVNGEPRGGSPPMWLDNRHIYLSYYLLCILLSIIYSIIYYHLYLYLPIITLLKKKTISPPPRK